MRFDKCPFILALTRVIPNNNHKSRKLKIFMMYLERGFLTKITLIYKNIFLQKYLFPLACIISEA